MGLTESDARIWAPLGARASEMAAAPALTLIGSELYRHSSYGGRHPLAIPRVSTILDLIQAMGWLEPGLYRDSPQATPAQLARFHCADYLAALQCAERDQRLDGERRRRYNLGGFENPIYPEVFRRPATAVGGSLLAAELLRHPGIVFSPAGGTHHGRPDRASGFCYLNDPVLGILRLLDFGFERILYLDIDAHHGDGVQDALAHERRVWTLSVHEQGRWPFTGQVEDRGGGQACNLPVPQGLCDSEMMVLWEEVIRPWADRLQPEVIVLQAGADALADDPLSRLSLSNRAYWRVAAALRDIAPRLLVLGGGGYNPWSVGRCWAGLWAVLVGHDPTMPPTPAALAILQSLHWHRARGRAPPPHWLTTLADDPNEGPVRPEITALVRTVRLR